MSFFPIIAVLSIYYTLYTARESTMPAWLRAGSWSLRALRLESDCGVRAPRTYICNIEYTGLVLVLFLLLPSLLRNVVYVTDNYLYITCSKTTQAIRGTWFTAFKH